MFRLSRDGHSSQDEKLEVKAGKEVKAEMRGRTGRRGGIRLNPDETALDVDDDE